ncbi:MAG TPA: hypothetical protein VMS75_02035 [Terriglobales bacterium]|nr:hypothetical protein [Terriglobales bacterium]
MARKITAFVELLAFLVFTTSCVYHVQEKRFAPMARERAPVKILAVQTKAREYIEFGEKRPARLDRKSVVGEALTTVEFARDDVVQEVAPTPETPGSITTKDGKQYRILARVFTLRPDGEKVVCQAYLPVTIPASEVQLAWIKSVNVGASLLQGLGVVLVVGLLIALLAVDEETGTDFVGSLLESTPESEAVPPPVYRDFWESYFIDAEFHGEAPGQGFSITEWTAVDATRGSDGTEKFAFGNELTVPKSTDALKIVVVDHPEGSMVVPDLEGTMHTVTAPLKPIKAYDQHRKNILSLVEKNDGLFWTSPEDEQNPRKEEELRDELIFEFPRPTGKAAKKAKLIVNATNTMWASHFAGRFLELPGASPARMSEPAMGPMSGGRARDWYREDEFYKLRVWVETRNGWQPRQTIYGGGPFIPRDKVSVIDVGDASGSTLKVKLMPPANFWMIDRIAVDYSKDLPVDVKELAPESAAAPGLSNEDVLGALAAVDGRRLDLPSSVDKVEMTFSAAPPGPGLRRSVFVKTVSRYEIRPSPGLQSLRLKSGRATASESFLSGRVKRDSPPRGELSLLTLDQVFVAAARTFLMKSQTSGPNIR